MRWIDLFDVSPFLDPFGSDHHASTRLHGLDHRAVEPKIQQGDALARGSKQRTIERIAQGLDPSRVPGYEQFPFGRQEGQRISSIEAFCCVGKDIDQGKVWIDRKLATYLMQDDFGIGVASQMMVSLAREFFFEFLVVGQLAVKTKTEPFVFVDVLALKGLSVVPIVLAAGRIPHVSDGCRADKLLHDRFVLAAMREAKDFADRSDVLVGFEQQRPLGVVAGHSRSQLAPVLNVLQHPGHEGRT